MRVITADQDQPATLEMGLTGYTLTLQKGLVSPMAVAILARVLNRI